MPKDTVYLVDGTSLCYRSFFAIKLSRQDGFPTGAVYGFYQTLKKIISKHKPFYMAVCFDVSRKTFRQEKFREYKIQRPPTPDGLKVQIPLIKKLINLLGIALVEQEGLEADDIIASLAHQARKKKLEVVVVSSDKDMFQLLNDEKIVVYNAAKEEFFNQRDFRKKFGFAPELMVDYLSLAGDASDNIPGARGIGPVAAAKLIKQFGTIENIFANLDKIAASPQRLLNESQDNVFLSKELVSLSPLDLDFAFEDLAVNPADDSALYELFRELEFKSLVKQLAPKSGEPSIEAIEAKEANKAKIAELAQAGPLILSLQAGQAYLSAGDEVFQIEAAQIKDILADDRIKKISHGFKQQQVARPQLEIKGLWFDVKVAAYLLDSTLGDYSLASLAAHYLKDSPAPAGGGAVTVIRQLYELFLPRLKENAMDKLFFEVEMPLIYVLSQMEICGVKVDLGTLDKLLREVDKRLKAAEGHIFKLAGHTFNLNSPKQLQVVLFKELKIPPLKKTKTGYSTNEAVLEKLSDKYPIALLLLEYRQLNKLKTTYILPLREAVKTKAGRLHAQFNQTAAQTGRLSSSAPNLQSIPVKGEFAAGLRRAFRPSFPEGVLLSGDYSQIELRILAHYSDDQRLKQAFAGGHDIHSYTASLLFPDSTDPDYQRNVAKRVNFGILYGMSPYGLAQELKITPTAAEAFIEDYFARYPKVREYIDKVYAQLEEQGYVTTILGRQRRLPDFSSSNPHLRDFARRQAVNTPIQGSCADLIKVAMVKIYNELKRRGLASRLIIQIHDELIFDVAASEQKEVIEIVRKNMQESIKLKVPVEVKLKTGKNWAEMEEL